MGMGRILGQLLSWVGTVYVMRLLNPADYGLAAISISVIAIISVVAEMGISAGLIQAPDVTRDQLRSVLGVSLVLGFSGTLLVIAIAPVAGMFFQSEAVVPLIQLGSFQLLLSSFSVIPDAMLRRAMRFKASAIVELISGVIASLATIYFAISGTRLPRDGWIVW